MHISPMTAAGFIANQDARVLRFVRQALVSVIGEKADDAGHELTGGEIDRAIAFSPVRASMSEVKEMAALTGADWQDEYSADSHAINSATSVLSALRQFAI